MADNKEETERESSAQETNHWCNHDRRKKIVVLGGLATFVAFMFLFFCLLAVGRLSRNRVATNRFDQRSIGQEFRGGRSMMGGEVGNRSMMFGFANGSLTGKVTTVDGQKLTVDVNGTSKTVQIATTTRFPLNSATKINVGDTVSVIGEQDSTGIVQAVRIVVNPTTIK